ncbi:MAG: hypothetical protein E4H01_11605 [Lysobacterales bacterium]|nr:MAG: hypothetical protein E4H01_11605 [Xanthomonadales bacterium]
MAIGDLYRAQCHISVRNSHTSFSLYYRETVADPPFDEDASHFAASVGVAITSELLACLSPQAVFSLITGYKVRGANALPGTAYIVNGAGQFLGNAIQNSNTLQLRLLQDEGPARHNGRIGIAGCGEDNSVTNNWKNDFIDNEVDDLKSAILAGASGSGGDDSEYELVVIEKGPTPLDHTTWTARTVSDIAVVTTVRSISKRRADAHNFTP